MMLVHKSLSLQVATYDIRPCTPTTNDNPFWVNAERLSITFALHIPFSDA